MSNIETISALAQLYITIKKTIEEDRHRLYDIEVEIKEMMNDIGATEVSLPNGRVKLESKTEYIKEMLTPLLEYEEIPEAELLRARIPEKIIPPSWNMTKVKPLAKYSERAKGLIEKSTVQGEPVLRITS
jgi:hypothetical protein